MGRTVNIDTGARAYESAMNANAAKSLREFEKIIVEVSPLLVKGRLECVGGHVRTCK